MRKGLILTVIMLFLIITPVFADNFDIALSIGQDNYKWWPNGLSFSYGVNFGLSQHFELMFYGISEICPEPFSNNLWAGEIDFAMIGKRTTGTKVSGSGINVLLGLGGFYSYEDKGAGPLVSVTPLTVGTPITGKRERLLKTTMGWDFVNNKFLIAFSLMNLDFYVRGTYRRYNMLG